MSEKKRALLSVSDKTGLVNFARGLLELGFEILSTGGTAKLLQENKLPVTKVSDFTGFPEILGGRIKTLHPKILGGVLARMDLDSDQNDLKKQNIKPIELVCVNLYPFAETISKGAVEIAKAIEQIDIGGPTMIRAAAKNYAHSSVVVDPKDYDLVLESLAKKEMNSSSRFALAKKAFSHTAKYDAMIAQYLHSFSDFEGAKKGEQKLDFPKEVFFSFQKIQDLRYGENPHQKAAYYQESSCKPRFTKLHGKELSFNNILDLEAAFSLVCEFEKPACVIVKHTNPCGVAINDERILIAYQDALACDSKSAFGGIVALNRNVEEDLAKALKEHFLEVILAPEFSPQALNVLQQKKNVRLLQMPMENASQGYDMKRVSQGLLLQDFDQGEFDTSKAKVVSKRSPTPQELKALDFAWKVVRHVKSNAIVLAKDNKTLGIGAGQMSRVDSSDLASRKAGKAEKGLVLASDAFFPFRDGIDKAKESGVTAIIQPGGSVRDEEVIKAANEHGMAMLFTGQRHFKH